MIKKSRIFIILLSAVLLSCSRKQDNLKPFDLVSRHEMKSKVVEVQTRSRVKKVVVWSVGKDSSASLDSILLYPLKDLRFSQIGDAYKFCLDSARNVVRADSIKGFAPKSMTYIINTVQLLTNDSRLALWFLIPFAILFIVFSSVFYIKSIWAEIR